MQTARPPRKHFAGRLQLQHSLVCFSCGRAMAACAGFFGKDDGGAGFQGLWERFSLHSQFLDVLGNSVLTQRSRQARQPHDPFCRVSWPSSDHHEGMYILVECGAAGLQFKHYALKIKGWDTPAEFSLLCQCLIYQGRG